MVILKVIFILNSIYFFNLSFFYFYRCSIQQNRSLVRIGDNLLKFRLVIIFSIISLIFQANKIYCKKSNNELRVPLLHSIRSLDPHKKIGISSILINRQIFEGLFGYNKSYDIVPLLVESWHFSDNLKTLSFGLKSDIEFHNGDKLTTKDVKATFLALAKSKSYTQDLNNIIGFKEFKNNKSVDIVGIKVIDERNIVFNLQTPDNNFIKYLTDFNKVILPAKLLKNNHNFSNKPIGTGPYLFTKKVKNQFILSRFKKYHSKRQSFLKIVFVKDIENLVKAFSEGVVDIFYSQNGNDINKINNYTKKIEFIPQMNLWYLRFSSNYSPLNNINLRKAIYWSIDPTKIKDMVGSNNEVAKSFILSGYLFRENKGKETHNIDLAKQYYKKYTKETNSNKKQKLNLLTINSMPNKERIVNYIKINLKEVGIKLVHIEKSLDGFIKMMKSRLNNTIVLQRYSLTIPDPSSVLLLDFSLDNKKMPGRVNSEEIRTLYLQSLQIKNMNKYHELFKKIDKNIIDNAYLKPILRENLLFAYSTKIKDIHICNFGFFNTLFKFAE